MLIPYAGKSEYCYANGLHMSLVGAGATAPDLPGVGFLECLTTMPFGTMYLHLEDGPLVFFSAPSIDPDAGVTRALATLGWTCDEWFGDDSAEALARLRAAVQVAPALVGPVDLGELPYNPRAAELRGGDHFVVALEMDDEQIRLHDPYGYPCVVLAPSELLTAWRADRIPYKRGSYTLRSRFQQVEQVSRQEAVARTLPLVISNLLADPGGPVIYGSFQALALLVADLRGDVLQALAGHLVYFALPLAARRCLDASSFLREAGNVAAAGLLNRKARLFGEAQSLAVRHDWPRVAELVERLAGVERELVQVLS
jgi:hypothetical protein